MPSAARRSSWPWITRAGGCSASGRDSRCCPPRGGSEERSPPLIVAVDHEGGRVQRFRQGFSLLPPARRIGHEFDLDARAGLALSRAMGWLMAAELRAHGVDISFAPCVDLDHGVSFIGDRSEEHTSELQSPCNLVCRLLL